MLRIDGLDAVRRPTRGRSGRRQRELAGEIRQRLERGSDALVHLGAGLRGQPRALLDQRQRRVGLQLAGSQPVGGLGAAAR